MKELTPGAHESIVSNADRAVQHELVADVISELLDNLKVTGQPLPEYGATKVASYAAQVAIAVDRGIDPDQLRTQAKLGDFDCCVTSPAAEVDLVNHPPHYGSHPSGVECITITEHMGFNLGNAVKYIWRADEKGAPIEDLEKARWYIEREISKRQKASDGSAS